MSHKHLTIHERIFIEQYFKDGYSISEIARLLERSKSTIGVEKHKFPFVYNANRAFKIARKNAQRIGNKPKAQTCQLDYLKEKLALQGSPEQIVNRYLHEYKESLGLSVSTIYRYVKQNSFGLNSLQLRHKGKKRKRVLVNKFNQNIKRIKQFSRNQLDFGHGEADTIVGKDHQSARLTLSEKLTNFTLTYKLDNVSSDIVFAKLKELFLQPCFLSTVKTLTLDNGREFAAGEEFERKTKIPVYFTDLGSPWQKPSIEHANKLIRQYLPKKIDLNKFNHAYDIEIWNRLNNRPRKKLNYKTPLEVIVRFLNI